MSYNFNIKTRIIAFILVVISSSVSAQLNKKQADSLLYDMNINFTIDKDSAILVTHELIDFYKKAHDGCGYIRALAQQGLNYGYTDKYKVGFQYILKAQKLYDKSECGQPLLAFLKYSLSYLYSKIRDYAKSDSIALQAINMYPEQFDNKSWGDGNFHDKATLIKLYLGLGGEDTLLDIVLPYAFKAYKLSKQFNYPILEQKALITIGTCYANSDSFESAKRYFNLALQVALKRNSYIDLGIIYNNLAGLSKDNDEVLRYIDSALYFANLSNNLDDLQTFTQNKALFYTMIKEYKKAYETLWKSMILKDTLLNEKKYKAITEIAQKYEAEKKAKEIQTLKLKNLNVEFENLKNRRAKNKLYIGSGILLLLAIILGYGFVMIQKNRNALVQKNIQLYEARKRSDELLLNILPYEIAEELKEKGKAEAKQFDIVSILFTDVIEFTQTAADLATTELVDELDYCFKGFDHIIEKYKIEKIKTIGDSYMAAGGLPVPSGDSVKNTVLAALEMQEFITQRKKYLDKNGKTSFEMRAGIHTGSVVAGIVGVKKFQYDVWGDTVNTASRLENAGMAGKVNISQTTFGIIKDDPLFSFTGRGKIKAKGKGEVEMYFVQKVV